MTEANATAERDSATEMVDELPDNGKRITLGGDEHYDSLESVADLRSMEVTPHAAQNNTHRRSVVDGCTTRHAGYQVSQTIRKRIEEIFG